MYHGIWHVSSLQLLQNRLQHVSWSPLVSTHSYPWSLHKHFVTCPLAFPDSDGVHFFSCILLKAGTKTGGWVKNEINDILLNLSTKPSFIDSGNGRYHFVLNSMLTLVSWVKAIRVTLYSTPTSSPLGTFLIWKAPWNISSVKTVLNWCR